MICIFCGLLVTGVVEEQSIIDEFGLINIDENPPSQVVYWIEILDGLKLVTVYSNVIHADILGVGVGVFVGVGVGVWVKLGIQSKQAPSTVDPISLINSTVSTPLMFSNKPS